MQEPALSVPLSMRPQEKHVCIIGEVAGERGGKYMGVSLLAAKNCDVSDDTMAQFRDGGNRKDSFVVRKY